MLQQNREALEVEAFRASLRAATSNVQTAFCVILCEVPLSQAFLFSLKLDRYVSLFMDCRFHAWQALHTTSHICREVMSCSSLHGKLLYTCSCGVLSRYCSFRAMGQALQACTPGCGNCGCCSDLGDAISRMYRGARNREPRGRTLQLSRSSRWRKLRAMLWSTRALESLLEKVRCRKIEELYATTGVKPPRRIGPRPFSGEWCRKCRDRSLCWMAS